MTICWFVWCDRVRMPMRSLRMRASSWQPVQVVAAAAAPEVDAVEDAMVRRRRFLHPLLLR